MVQIVRINAWRLAIGFVTSKDNVIRTNEDIAVAMPAGNGADVDSHGIVSEPVISHDQIAANIRCDRSLLHGDNAFRFGDGHDRFKTKLATIPFIAFSGHVTQLDGTPFFP